MEMVYIPVGELIMSAELSLPEGEGPFELYVWIMHDNPIDYPKNKAVLWIREVVDHPLWFAALCDEIRMQDFYSNLVVLWVETPVIPFKSIASHPFSIIAGEYSEDLRRYISGKAFS
jgi:hypothetical protein